MGARHLVSRASCQRRAVTEAPGLLRRGRGIQRAAKAHLVSSERPAACGRLAVAGRDTASVLTMSLVRRQPAQQVVHCVYAPILPLWSPNQTVTNSPGISRRDVLHNDYANWRLGPRRSLLNQFHPHLHDLAEHHCSSLLRSFNRAANPAFLTCQAPAAAAPVSTKTTCSGCSSAGPCRSR